MSLSVNELAFVALVSMAVTFHCGTPSTATCSPIGSPSMHLVAVESKSYQKKQRESSVESLDSLRYDRSCMR